MRAHGAAEVDHGGGLRLEGGKDALGVRPVGNLGLKAVDVAQVERAVHVEGAAGLQAQLVQHDLLELLVKAALDLQAHRLEALTHLEDLLHVLAVVLFLLHALVVRVDVGVAGYAQHAGAAGRVVAEAAVQEEPEHVLQKHVAEGSGAGAQGHHALLAGGNLDDAKGVGLGQAVERAGHVEPPAPQVGEGVARVHHHGRDDGCQVRLEVPGELGHVLLRELGAPQTHEALLAKLCLHLGKARGMPLHQGRQRLEDGVELTGGRLVGLVVPGLVLEGGEVREPAHADHEPLLEVGIKDLAELQALEEGHLGVKGLVHHAVVEHQPGELAVLRVGVVALAEVAALVGLRGDVRELRGRALQSLALLGGPCGLRLLSAAHESPFRPVCPYSL